MIFGPAYGDIAFTVPLFDEFMARAIPKFTPCRVNQSKGKLRCATKL
jgi:hypothetical protein